MCSAELAQYLDSQMVPAINETRNACTKADVTASERGTVITKVLCRWLPYNGDFQVQFLQMSDH